MTQEPAPRFVSLPPLAFRVGVTGAAALDAAAQERLRPRVASLLGRVKAALEALAADKRVADVYAADAEGGLRPKLRIASPLGEGADRLVACAALGLGYELEVALPFAQPAYEATFPSSVAEFREHLAQAGARVVTLDGDAADPVLRPRSYGAVGRHIVRNCDLLIAIWDDKKPPKGAGGTTDTVRFAVHSGIPVLWLHPGGTQESRLITDILHLAQPEDALAGEAAIDTWLSGHLAELIVPPAPQAPPKPGAIEKMAERLRERRGDEADPLRAFLGEVERQNHWIWSIHDRLLGPPRRKPNPAAASAPKRPAAVLSRLYQARYRSSYVFVFGLGALALLAASIGLAFDGLEGLATLAEALVLLAILFLVLVNAVARWQERYMSYRLLAELFRLQRQLRILGWSLPPLDVSGLALRSGRGWVGWYFAAHARATPPLQGVLSGERLAAARRRIAARLIDEQILFHRRRRAWKRTSAKFLERWGVRLFLVTIAVVFVKAMLLVPELGHAIMPLFGLAAVLSAAVAAASFGIRAYEEMELLAEQSDRMLEALIAASERVDAIRLDRPLALQLLAGEVYEVAMLMLADVNGWAQLFRMKAIGVG